MRDENYNTPKDEILEGLKEAIKEVKLYQEGKLGLLDAKELK